MSFCVICTERKSDLCIKPCMHICLCSQCPKLLSCPICRVDIQETFKVFISGYDEKFDADLVPFPKEIVKMIGAEFPARKVYLDGIERYPNIGWTDYEEHLSSHVRR